MRRTGRGGAVPRAIVRRPSARSPRAIAQEIKPIHGIARRTVAANDGCNNHRPVICCLGILLTALGQATGGMLRLVSNIRHTDRPTPGYKGQATIDTHRLVTVNALNPNPAITPNIQETIT
jgi:hypothetical protein